MLHTNANPLQLPDWREPGVAAIGRALRDRCRISASDHLVVAVSGGADSASLLLALRALAERREHAYHLTVGHVNHGLRGEKSDADAAAVSAWCEMLHVECHVIDVDLATEPSDNVEAAARMARYRVLENLAQQCGATAVVTAHHRQDQLETVLMALVRGAGLSGMAGMSWRRDLSQPVALVRPMMAVDRNWTRALCERAGLHWREDATNLDVTRTRAGIRASVSAELEAIRPGVAERVVAATELWRDAAEMVSAAAASAFGESETWERAALRGMRSIVIMEGLRQASLRQTNGRDADSISLRKLSDCAQAIRGDSTKTRCFTISRSTEIVVAAQVVTLNNCRVSSRTDGET